MPPLVAESPAKLPRKVLKGDTVSVTPVKPPEGAVDAHVEPLEVSTFPDVDGATT